MNDLLQQGITAYKAGNRDEARKFFITVVKQKPESERAWGWMYDVSGDDKERIYCLKQILRINPKNGKANQLLNQLLAPPSFSSNPSLTPISSLSLQDNFPKNVEEKSNNKIDIVLAVVLVFALLCLCVVISQTSTFKIFSPPTPTEIPEIAKARWSTVDLRDLVKNPNSYNGRELHYKGEVFSVEENSDGTVMQVWARFPLGAGEYYTEAVIVYWAGNSDNIYEGTEVEFWGYGDGTFEGTNAFGGTIRQPTIQAEYLTYFH